MEIITIGSEKGGVGKTYITICLASALASFGYRVLVVDMDKSGNFSTTALTEMPDMYMYDVLLGRCKLKSIIKKTPICDVAPTIQDTGANESEFDIAEDRSLTQLAILRAGKDAEGDLRKVLMNPVNQIKDNYDFVLIDTGASDGLLIKLPLVAADRTLLVAELTPNSHNGLKRFMTHINTVKEKHNPYLEIDGLIFTNYSEDSETQRNSMRSIRQTVEENEVYCYNTVLRSTKLCDKIFERGVPVEEFLYAGTATIDAFNLALEFLNARQMPPRRLIPGTYQTENGDWAFQRLPKHEYDKAIAAMQQ